jgi:hypothetical protein
MHSDVQRAPRPWSVTTHAAVRDAAASALSAYEDARNARRGAPAWPDVASGLGAAVSSLLAVLDEQCGLDAVWEALSELRDRTEAHGRHLDAYDQAWQMIAPNGQFDDRPNRPQLKVLPGGRAAIAEKHAESPA